MVWCMGYGIGGKDGENGEKEKEHGEGGEGKEDMTIEIERYICMSEEEHNRHHHPHTNTINAEHSPKLTSGWIFTGRSRFRDSISQNAQ